MVTLCKREAYNDKLLKNSDLKTWPLHRHTSFHKLWAHVTNFILSSSFFFSHGFIFKTSTTVYTDLLTACRLLCIYFLLMIFIVYFQSFGSAKYFYTSVQCLRIFSQITVTFWGVHLQKVEATPANLYYFI